jgi:protein gp37
MPKTKIQWTDRTWNPVTGCTPISEACRSCYAERMARRLAGRAGYPRSAPFSIQRHADRLNQLTGIRKASSVFVCSMGDLFHRLVPDKWIFEVLDRANACAEKTGSVFQFLTKRPHRMVKAVERWTDKQPDFGGLHPGLWFGVTAENQVRADERVPELVKLIALDPNVLFVSAEPLLGPLDLTRWLECGKLDGRWIKSGFRPELSWVIAGGQTGPGANPSHPRWFYDLEQQCAAAGVPFFFKSWGHWHPVVGSYRPSLQRIILLDGRSGKTPEDLGFAPKDDRKWNSLRPTVMRPPNRPKDPKEFYEQLYPHAKVQQRPRMDV